MNITVSLGMLLVIKNIIQPPCIMPPCEVEVENYNFFLGEHQIAFQYFVIFLSKYITIKGKLVIHPIFCYHKNELLYEIYSYLRISLAVMQHRIRSDIFLVWDYDIKINTCSHPTRKVNGKKLYFPQWLR